MGIELVGDSALLGLAHLRPVELLELGAVGSHDVVVLPEEAPLPRVGEGVDVVAPAAGEVEPRRRGARVLGRGYEPVRFSLVELVLWHLVTEAGFVVVVIGVVVEGRVPERALVGDVLEEAKGDDVRVVAGEGIHGMGADGRVDDGPAVFRLLNGVPGVSLPALVLREENATWVAILETHHAVFPVADMIAEAHAQNSLTKVVGVKEEPESIDDTVSLVHHDKHSGGSREAIIIWLVPTSRKPLGVISVGTALPVLPRICDSMQRMVFVYIVPIGWLILYPPTIITVVGRVIGVCRGIRLKRVGDVVMAMEPRGTRLDVVVAAKNDFSLDIVEFVKVIERPLFLVLGCVHRLIVDVDRHVLNMLLDIRRPELFAGIEVHQRRISRYILGDILQYSSAPLGISLAIDLWCVLFPIGRSPLQLPAHVVVEFIPACGGIFPQVVKAAEAHPSTSLAVPEVRAGVDPAPIFRPLLRTLLGRVHGPRYRPCREGEHQHEGCENGYAPYPNHCEHHSASRASPGASRCRRSRRDVLCFQSRARTEEERTGRKRVGVSGTENSVPLDGLIGKR